jgi:anti-sigma regulatory factor (Ser/Thr protein kinase)
LPRAVSVWHNRNIPTDLELALDGNAGELDRLATQLGDFCRRNGLEGDVEFDLNLVLEELFMNTIRHGGCRDQAGAARIRLRVAGGAVDLEYSDRGIPFNPLDAPPARIDAPLEERKPGGLGIHLVRQIMSDVRYRRSDGENHLTMARRMEAK